MRHYPVFLDMRDRTVLVAGGGEVAVAKLRLLLKTEARLRVFAATPDAAVAGWAAEGRIELVARAIEAGDVPGSALVYGATGNALADARVARLARGAGVPVNLVDNLEGSDFITPAIVDRDPVTVAIGTEGAAPVLARKIKAEVEAMLPTSLGSLARIGQAFRGRVEHLDGKARRGFWTRFYFQTGPRALAEGQEAAEAELGRMLGAGAEAEDGFVHFVGAGPGDPELLTLKARRLLHEADVVIHDRLVSPGVLELARREATIIEVGKTGFGPSWKQDDINALLVLHAASGATVVRLKGGDPAVFGRLDEEIEALETAGVRYAITPGITSASAAAAAIGQSLTKRGRNAAFRILTGHDVEGFAEHDWRELAKPGATAAIYMGKRAATFLRGRLMMHGASADTPVTAVENASLASQRLHATTLLDLPRALDATTPGAPTLILIGLAPRAAALALADMKEAL
ncbi:uroporphyrin-III C-methyltransferase/precorrin-2 dehydrogenase/sirohydrochlorin ferrochelatase [Amaricoccus macauensis]|uniref:Uroporphyrin-III C-methyltransferase/precorrin-2 dehydrogenase/sirohydrochlorin ferrochelatase n=1 Tax=Amaricoccus macauensis TaxID=57001 RepID=A0A840SL75_9RHOB|nr:siroheme synthase CysG [Amaricoccus macauensis]MBB5222707.1 uroporphyrin-III C-methyltransferase/precorrin-2 dehydrogenase/sirohydrochlorin ferrochelatase [Amaricoccus macauensis]